MTAVETPMHEGFRIRLATIADAETIASHRARMFRDMGQLTEEAFQVLRLKSRERIEQDMRAGSYVSWLASLAGAPNQLIAGAGIQLRRVPPHPTANPAEIADGRHGVIVNVFTEPEWRRRGLAAFLLRQIIDWARVQKLDRLLLHASKEGRSLYERLGFVATNEMKFVGE